jgi:hypothetical protein
LKKEWAVGLVLVWAALVKPLPVIKEFVKKAQLWLRRIFYGKIKC